MDEHTKLPDHPAWMRHSGDELHLFREIMRSHQAVTHAFTRAVGMPGSRLVLLRLLATSEPAEPGVLQIARCLGVDPAAITRQVQEMEAGGLVARRADPLDRRRSLVRLTDAGRESFGRLHERAHAFERDLTASLSPEDLATAARVLAHVRAALEAIP